MARGKADRGLTVGKKLEIIEEADRTGLLAATAQKYNVKPGQIRDWKKNIDRLRATDPSRLVCASTIQRGHLVFNETYAQYWVGYNKFCSSNTEYEGVKHAMHITLKDIRRDGINVDSFPLTIDPTATHALECPLRSDVFAPPADDVAYANELTALRTELATFFNDQPIPTKSIYFVTRLDFWKPKPGDNDDDDEEDKEKEDEAAAEAAAATTTGTTPAAGDAATPIDREAAAMKRAMTDVISVYVAICGNGSVMVPMTVFPPPEKEHWERKKPVKLRHAHSLHRTRQAFDPLDALQFFSVTWKKQFEEDATYNDKFVFVLDAFVSEFHDPAFTAGVAALDGFNKHWTTMGSREISRNPLEWSHFGHIMEQFVRNEWRSILSMKKSAQPNDYRKCVAFWFYSVWEFFAGENARAALRTVNLLLDDRSAWSTGGAFGETVNTVVAQQEQPAE